MTTYVTPAHGAHEVVGGLLLFGRTADARRSRGGRGTRSVLELVGEQRPRQLVAVQIGLVVLAAGEYVAVVCLEADEVLLVDVAGVGARALALVELPHLEIAVGGGRDELVLAAELDVADGLLVALEERDGLLRVAQIVVVNAVVGRAEQHVELRVRLEHHTAHVRLGVDREQRVVIYKWLISNIFIHLIHNSN